MKPAPNYWWIICFILGAFLCINLIGLVVAQDQSPPSGMDKGVWVLTDTKPDLVVEQDWENGAYYNNHGEVSGTSLTGGYSWKDADCSGKVLGTSTWTAPPGTLVPGSKQETTLTAKIDGSQNCGYKFVRTSTSMSLVRLDDANDMVWFTNLKPEAGAGFATNDPNPGLNTSKLLWEAPSGKIGEKLLVRIGADPPGVRGTPSWATAALIYYNYTFQAQAPATPPSSTLPAIQKGKEPVPEAKAPSGPCDTSEVKIGRWAIEECSGKCHDYGARFSDIGGQVEQHHCWDDEKAWIFAELGSVICVNDIVHTSEDSAALISFNDMTSFMMKSCTAVVFDFPKNRVKLVSGNIWLNVKKMLETGNMDVEMSQAVAGIKGTILVCEESGTESTVKVLEGTVTFKSNTTGEEILVNAGEMATSTSSGLSRPQPFDVEAEKASWEKYLPKTEVAETNQSKVIFDNWNKGGVENNPSCNPSFTISEPQMITYVDSYHWNQGKGTASGGTLALKNSDGIEYGPWPVKTQSGGSVPNVLWIAHPDTVIPAGTYSVFDSEPATWSQNSESGGCGFTKVEGYATAAAPKGTSTSITGTHEPTKTTEPSTIPTQVVSYPPAKTKPVDTSFAGTPDRSLPAPSVNQNPSMSGPATIGSDKLLYSDDFSDSNSGWARASPTPDANTMGYENGKYHILEKKPGDQAWSSSPKSPYFSDFAVEVEATQEDGPNNNGYGFMLRRDDNGNFYNFYISGDGNYRFDKLINGKWTEIVTWTQSSEIKTGNALNIIRVEAKGNKFTFYANGAKMGEAQDSSIPSGRIGLVVGAYEERNVHISFDNVKVRGL